MRSRRAFTLAEVLVVTGLLALLSTMLYEIYSMGLNAESRSGATGGAYRQAALTLEQIRRELRGARLVAPSVGATLNTARFLQPQRRGGMVVVNAAGQPTWEPLAEVTVDATGTVRCRERVLGHLGPQGSLSFRRPSATALEITVKAQATDRRAESRHELVYRMLLLNQE